VLFSTATRTEGNTVQTHSTHHQAAWRCSWAALILAGGLLAIASTAESAWTAAIKPDPITRQPRCLLSSDPQITSDGYDSTPVTLVFNGTSLLAVTKSELDIFFNDLQLVVDKEPPFRSDKLKHKKMTLVFDHQESSVYSAAFQDSRHKRRH
jgi:hypothetical protein